MYELFDKVDVLQIYSRDNLYENQQIRLLEEQVNKWIHYLNISDRNMVGNIVFYKIIMHLQYVPFNGNYESYALDISNVCDFMLTPLGICHYSGKGILYKNLIYSNVSTLLVQDTSDFNFMDLDNLDPVKIIYHPFKQLSLIDLHNLNYDKPEYAVAFINIPLLMCQYQRYIAQDREIRTVPSFINKVLIPSLYKSHIARCVLNRYISNYFEETPDVYQSNKTVLIRNMTQEIDRFIVRNLDFYKKHTLEYTDILETIYVPYYGTCKNYLLRPDIYVTSIMKFSLYLSYIDVVYFLLKLNHNGQNFKNQFLINYTKRAIIEASSNKLLEHGLPKTLQDYFKAYIDKLKPLVGFH